ncbi:hypothetical protein Tco_0868981 [Tanacetum coccineum]
MMHPGRLCGQLRKKLRWLKVGVPFLKIASMEGRRTYDMVVGKWKTVRPAVVQFCGVYGNVMRMAQESGAGDEDYVQREMIHYQDETGVPIKFRHYWDVRFLILNGSLQPIKDDSQDVLIQLTM